VIFAVYVPLLAALLTGLWFRTERFLPGHPAVRTWTITLGSAVTAMLSTWSLVLLATARIDRVAYITERVHLIGGVLRRTDHVPLPVSILAVILLAVRFNRVFRALYSFRRARRAADRFRDRNPGTLVVVADDEPIAFALAGNRRRCGTVVVSTGLFAAVPAEQRRAVLAHEHAHLALHHHCHRGVVNISIALEPWLSPAATLSGQAIERWADEQATNNAVERRTAAQAITTFMDRLAPQGRAGSTTTATQMLGGLAYADNLAEAAKQRIDALLDTPPQRRIIDAFPVCVLIMLIMAASGDATQQLAHLIHAAIR
jgi:beta-lactamase regulating signal transducer with metallopeptidase domain